MKEYLQVNTSKIRALLEGHDVHVLLDSGCSLSFLHENVVKLIKNKVIGKKTLTVMVANA